MIKMLITDAVVSRGYDGAPAIRFYDGEGGSTQIANFRIGKRVYDSREQDNHRWLNFQVKAFGDVCDRIKRMKLKEGSYVTLIARYDEDTWEDKNTHEKRTGVVLILEEIEFSGSGGGQKSNQNGTGGSAAPQGGDPQGAPQQVGQGYPQQQVGQGHPPQGVPGQTGQPSGMAPGPMPENFTGYTPFGGVNNPYF